MLRGAEGVIQKYTCRSKWKLVMAPSQQLFQGREVAHIRFTDYILFQKTELKKVGVMSPFEASKKSKAI